jgi:predicted metal-binding protein
MKKDYSQFIKKAMDLGAKDAKIIRTSTIVTAQWVNLKCQFGCGGYGRRLTCPPYSPTPEQTSRMVAEYISAILIHGDRYTDIREIVSTLEREIFLAGYYKALGMGAGPCHICKTCGKFCKYPERARPSMEASGIDVYATVRANGFPIEVVKTTNCAQNYYGIVLIE